MTDKIRAEDLADAYDRLHNQGDRRFRPTAVEVARAARVVESEREIKDLEEGIELDRIASTTWRELGESVAVVRDVISRAIVKSYHRGEYARAINLRNKLEVIVSETSAETDEPTK